MNKLTLCAFAIAALGAGPLAQAQDGGAECQAGSAWGPKPGCGAGPSGAPYVAPQAHPYAYDNSGALPPQRYDPYAHVPRDIHGRPLAAAPAHPRLRPTRRDRDGDGVANRRDRYPDDPYRH